MEDIKKTIEDTCKLAFIIARDIQNGSLVYGGNISDFDSYRITVKLPKNIRYVPISEAVETVYNLANTTLEFLSDIGKTYQVGMYAKKPIFYEIKPQDIYPICEENLKAIRLILSQLQKYYTLPPEF